MYQFEHNHISSYKQPVCKQPAPNGQTYKQISEPDPLLITRHIKFKQNKKLT